MTSPEDDDQLAEALRRALAEAANEVEPGSDGLDKIHARIANRPPRPWLLSVLFGVAERVRNWTWRGHWAWPDWPSRLAEVRWPQLRRGSFPPWSPGSLRLAAVLAGVAVIASVTLGVQPVRNAIVQAGTALDSDRGSQPAPTGTAAGGTRSSVAGDGTPSPEARPTGGTRTNAGSVPGAGKAPGTTEPHSSKGGKCTSSGSAVVANSPSWSASNAAVPTVSTTAAPAPVYTDTSVVTCPVTSPAKSAKPTPTPTGSDSAGGASPDSDYSTSPDSDYSNPASGEPTGSYPSESYPTERFPTGGSPTGGYPTRTPAATVYPGPSGYDVSRQPVPPSWPDWWQHTSGYGRGR